MKRFTAVWKRIGIAVAAATICACAGGYGAQRGGPRGYLRLEIEPSNVEVEIDEEYSGVADGWADGVIPVSPGTVRLTLSADGYITQRFDIAVAAYEEVTLILALERTLEVPDEPARVRRTTLGATR